MINILGASTAMCENVFSNPKNLLIEQRLGTQRMLHQRKAQLVQLAL
jgi:hypothetical protein